MLEKIIEKGKHQIPFRPASCWAYLVKKMHISFFFFAHFVLRIIQGK